MHQGAVDEVCEDMKQQSHANYAGFGKEEQDRIQTDGDIRMKWMKTDAAAKWIENWCRQKVI